MKKIWGALLILLIGLNIASSFGLKIGTLNVVNSTSEQQNNSNSQTQEITFTNTNSDNENKNNEILKTQFFNSEPEQLQEIKLSAPERKNPKINLILSLTFISMLFLSVYLIKFVEIPNNTK